MKLKVYAEVKNRHELFTRCQRIPYWPQSQNPISRGICFAFSAENVSPQGLGGLLFDNRTSCKKF